MAKALKIICAVMSLVSLVQYIFETDPAKRLDHLVWAVFFQVNVGVL